MDWNQLFGTDANCERAPQSEVLRFIRMAESRLSCTPLRIWDLGCGAGRHTLAIAGLGHDAYGSDCAPKGIERTQLLLGSNGLSAQLALADMTTCPWPGARFHGVISWDTIHHNTLANIGRSLNIVHDSLLPGGLFMGTLKSDKADLYGSGEEVEPSTFILNKGKEAGVPHHYFNEQGIREVFDSNKWKLLVLAEQVITNYEHSERFWEMTPFPFTTWGVLAERLPDPDPCENAQ